jgi:hypothetical protein
MLLKRNVIISDYWQMVKVQKARNNRLEHTEIFIQCVTR